MGTNALRQIVFKRTWVLALGHTRRSRSKGIRAVQRLALLGPSKARKPDGLHPEDAKARLVDRGMPCGGNPKPYDSPRVDWIYNPVVP